MIPHIPHEELIFLEDPQMDFIIEVLANVLKVSVHQLIPFNYFLTFLCKENFYSKKYTKHRVKMNCTMSISPLNLMPYNSTWTWLLSYDSKFMIIN